MWKRTKQLENNGALDNVENKLGISIPIELRQLILENNGGRPMPNSITLNGTEYKIGWLLSYNEGDTYSIFKVLDYFIEKYKCNILPFATEESGDYYCAFREINIIKCKRNAPTPKQSHKY